jgi:hypothetical protein
MCFSDSSKQFRFREFWTNHICSVSCKKWKNAYDDDMQRTETAKNALLNQYEVK